MRKFPTLCAVLGLGCLTAANAGAQSTTSSPQQPYSNPGAIDYEHVQPMPMPSANIPPLPQPGPNIPSPVYPGQPGVVGGYPGNAGPDDTASAPMSGR